MQYPLNSPYDDRKGGGSMTVVEQAGRGHLLRILGVGFGVAVAIGGMLGSGILRTPNLLALDVPSIPLILGLWLFGAIDAALGVNVFAEMATAVPSAGGAYDYARRSFGDVLGLIVGCHFSYEPRPCQ